MKYLKLNETFLVATGQEYNCLNYPETGVYFSPAGYVLVNKESSLAFYIGPNINLTEHIEPTQQQSNITEAFILKALAVAQRPELIKEII